MKKTFLFIILITFPILCLAQGKSKAGKYVELYNIPFYAMTFDNGRAFSNGVMQIRVDIEDGYNAIYLRFFDKSGEYIDHEFFLDEYPPTVFNYSTDENVNTTGGGTATISNLYELRWGDQRYLFYLMKLPSGRMEYKVERLYVENGRQIRKDNSFTCTLDKSCLLNIGRVFREANLRNAIRLKIK